MVLHCLQHNESYISKSDQLLYDLTPFQNIQQDRVKTESNLSLFRKPKTNV